MSAEGWTLLIFSWESYTVDGDVSNSIGGGAREVSPQPPPLDVDGVQHN